MPGTCFLSVRPSFRATDAQVDGEGEHRDIREVGARHHGQQRRDVGEGRDTDARALQVLDGLLQGHDALAYRALPHRVVVEARRLDVDS